MATLHDNDNTLLALVRTTFDAHSAVLFLPDQSGNYTVALSSTDNEPSVQEVTIAPGKGLVGWILRHKQPVIVNNLDMRHTFLGYYDENDEGAHFRIHGLPTSPREEPCAWTACAHGLHRRRPASPPPFRPAPRPASPFRRLACDAEDLRRYFTRLEQLSELSAQNPHWRDYLGAFLRLMAESTEFEYVAFATAQEGGSTYTVEGENTPLLITEDGMPELPLTSGGLVSWVFRNEVPVHAEGADGSPSTPLFGKLPGVPNFQSVMCLPVHLNKSHLAAFCVSPG